jgi:hypothetical protein
LQETGGLFHGDGRTDSADGELEIDFAADGNIELDALGGGFKPSYSHLD